MLLERDGHLQRLLELLTRAEGGHGCVLALGGEAGVGKTSLVDLFERQIAARARVLRSACEDLSIPEPLGPLYDLAAALGLVAQQFGPTTPRLQLFSEVLANLVAAERATVLVIEDIHWADDATLDLVQFLGRRISGTKLLLILTARNDEVEGQRRLRRAVAEVPADAVRRIEIPLLSAQAVSELASVVGLDGAAVFRATEGNPFFTSELVAAGKADGLPGGVSDAVIRRVERLSDPARLVLDVAAVVPRRVEHALLFAAIGSPDRAAIDECVAAGLLIASAEHFQFRHEIARRAVEAALPQAMRQAINQRILDTLQALPDPSAIRMVHHAREARDLNLVWRLAPAAATEAAGLGSHREAASLFAAALDGDDARPVGERAPLLMQLAIELYVLGRTEDALRRLKQARQIFIDSHDALREGDCLRWISRLHYLNGNRIAAVAEGDAAVERLSRLPAGPELAMALSNKAQLAMLADRVEETLVSGLAALDLARLLGRRDIASHALNNIGVVRQWVSWDAARADLRESLELALADDLHEHAARAYTNLGYVLLLQLAHAEAGGVLEDGIAYCIEHDLDTWRDYMRAWQGELLLRLGHWDDAGLVALSVLDNPHATPLARFPAMLTLARLRTRRGDDPQSLIVQLDAYLERGSELQRLAPYAVFRAERAWIENRGLTEASDRLDQAIGLLPSRTLFSELFFWRSKLTGTPQDGKVMGQFAAPDMPFERALVMLEHGSDKRSVAIAALEHLGASAAVERATLDQRPTSPARRGAGRLTKANPTGLTAREMEILQLIERGLSNKAIARSLSISAKTVDHHVSAVLGKLGVVSRGLAGARARDLGLAQPSSSDMGER